MISNVYLAMNALSPVAFELPPVLSSLTGYTQIAVLADSHTTLYCYPLIKKILPAHDLITVPAGEEHKTISTCEFIWQKLTTLNFDRHSLVVVLGGGVLGDMGGFCAATFKRGIDFILVPTTLLSQVDASIGGKLGVDFMNFKNHIGIFCSPRATLIHVPFLKTLPERELRSGFAEIIKHCLISDKAMWQKIKTKKLLEQDWETLVKHSVEFKKSVTEKDPKETGLRKILNFGHTVGHALESFFLSKENRLFHGEAIAQGMIMESYLAHHKKMISSDELKEISVFILSIFQKVTDHWDAGEIIERMLQDKKNRGHEIRLALPDGIGKAQWDVKVSREEILESFNYYQSL